MKNPTNQRLLGFGRVRVKNGEKIIAEYDRKFWPDVKGWHKEMEIELVR